MALWDQGLPYLTRLLGVLHTSYSQSKTHSIRPVARLMLRIAGIYMANVMNLRIRSFQPKERGHYGADYPILRPLVTTPA